MNHIAINPSVIKVTLANIEADMALLMTMNEAQRQFLDYMIGKTRVEPDISLANQLTVADNLMDVMYGYPIAQYFDDVRFPARFIADRVRRQRTRIQPAAGAVPTKRDRQQRRRAKRSIASYSH